MKTSKKRIEAGIGEPCPRCRQQSVRFEHPPDFIPPTHKGWYSFWFECRNPKCITTTFMRGGYNPPASAPAVPLEAAAPGFADALQAINTTEELRDAADHWLKCYLGLYTVAYGPERLESMMADPVEGKRVKETQALLERTRTDVPW